MPVTQSHVARAKLTTSLRIVGVRDDGYHLLDAEMVSLAFGDTLTFADGDGLSVTGPFADGVPTDETNLVAKALRAVGRRARVAIDKQIPSGGGLGGGSADAAAVLAWAGCHDVALAASIGADVPFCLLGGGRARVSGVGECVEPLPFVAADYTLIIPPLVVSTVAAYRAWDALGRPPSARRDDGASRDRSANDLEPAALAVEPRLATWRDRIIEAAGAIPTLAGSGSTWFVEGARGELAEALAPALVVVTRTDRP